MKRVLSAAAVAACTLVLCTACVGGSTPSANAGGTSSGSPATASSTTAGTSTGSTNTATQAAGGTTSSAAGSGSGGTATGNGGASSASTCSARYLNGTVSGEQGTAGSIYVDIVFKNLNNKPCTMYGYPGVSFGAGTPVQQIGQPAARDPRTSPALVTLQPGGYAYAILQIGDAANWSPTTCQPTSTAYLQVYPPNTSNLLYVAYDSTGCKGDIVTLHVQAVQPGSGA
jgi:hypothetical protein